MNTAWRYVAWTKDDKLERGTIGASTAEEARRGLQDRGYRPIKVSEQPNVINVAKWFKGHPPERLPFFRSFAALASAGSGYDDAFRVLQEQSRAATKRGLLKNAPWAVRKREAFVASIRGVGDDVMSGTKLAEALARRPDTFTDIESAMVQIGDETGNMARVLDAIATFLERDRKFGKSLRDALVYPIIVMSFASLLIFYMITFLIPQFADLYVSFGVDLPGIMKFMLSLAGWMKSPFTWIIVIGALIGGLLLFSRAVATPGGALAFDRFRLAIPILGDLQEKVTVSRLCRTLSMLFEAGKTPLRALEICIPVTESPYYAKAMTDARDLFRKGAVSNLGEAFIRTGAFEPLLTGFLLVGVKAGNVGEMLAKIAGYYEDDIVSLTAMIPNVTQTVVTIVLGGVVGVIVYCVYVPMSQLVAGIH